METQTRSIGLYGYPWRSSGVLHKEYPSAKCTADTKPSIGKSFTIDALLSKPDKQTNDRSKPAHSGGKNQPVACSLAFQRQMCSPMPTYLYTPNIVHSQPGYPTYYPPFSYQATFREGFFTQEMTAKFHHQPFKCKAGKLKRMRTSFTNEQLSRLEKEFSRQQYMVGSERFVLASSLQLTEAQVKVWFQNRRIKFRKQTLDQQQAKVTKIDLAPVSQGCDEEGDEEEVVFSEDSDVDVEGSDL